MANLKTEDPSSKLKSFGLRNQVFFINLSALAVLIAVFLGRIYALPNAVSASTIYATLALGGFCFWLSSLRKLTTKRFFRVAFIVLIGLAAFLYSSNIFIRNNSYQTLYQQNLSLSATVTSDAAYNSYGDYEFDIEEVELLGGSTENPNSRTTKLKGKIKVKTKQTVSVHRGNRVLVEGKLRPALGSRIGTVSYAKVEVLNSKLSKLEELRLSFFQNVFNSLPEPHASLAIGFLVGSRSLVPNQIQDALNKTGLSHIIAVSGYNLTIIVIAVSKLGRKRLSKRQRLAISLSLIAIFMLFTGFSPSIVRASLVSFLALIAAFYGRRPHPLSLILVSAAITAGLNPVYLWSDLGWWLSFLAFFGILILSPILKTIFFKGKEPNLMLSIVLETSSAQILTAPLIAWAFGTFSVIGLAANMLVLPTVPIIMLFTFLLGLAYFFSKTLALLLAFLPRLILTLDVWIVEKLSSLSWAQLNLSLSLGQMLLAYLLIMIFCLLKFNRLGEAPSNQLEELL